MRRKKIEGYKCVLVEIGVFLMSNLLKKKSGWSKSKTRNFFIMLYT